MRWRSALRWAFVLLAVLLVASWGVSRALAAGWGRRALLARLSASFGRPVEVRRFEFNLLAGPQLEADSVTVSEDPRFGNEYFLRADQITASLAWRALLRGKIELQTLSLTHPSLNLVRNTDGVWNIEYWLPPVRPAVAQASGPSAVSALPSVGSRVAHIEVDGGRINFKRGAEKLQFALTGVTGTLDQDSSGRWSIDLGVSPARASVSLQDVGSLRLRGTVAGTSARLRPAYLTLSWEDASAADALRLAKGTDYGVRGTLAAEFSASIQNSSAAESDRTAGEWTVQGSMRLAGVHRWNLAARSADPAVNLTISASWRPDEPNLEVTRYVLDSPHSQLAGMGRIDWARGFAPKLEVVSSRIDLGDILAWRRSFTSGLANDLAVDGLVHVNGQVAGWPPRIEAAEISSAGATVRTGSLPGPVDVGPVAAGMKAGVFVMQPVPLNFPGVPGVQARATARGASRASAPEDPPSAGALRVSAEVGPFHPGAWPKEWTYRLALSGEVSRVQDVAAFAKAFGWPAQTGWTFEGAAVTQLAWTGALGKRASLPSGKLDLSDFRVATVALNRPLVIGAAHVELGPDGPRVKLADAQAFGGRWVGTLAHPASAPEWTFDLTADRVDVEDLDRWLGPRARPGFFRRLLPFGASENETQVLEAVIDRIKGKGRLRIGELALSPLQLTKLDAAAELDGRSVRIDRAQADLYGGHISGEFTASVSAEPSYSFRGTLDRVNLAVLSDASPVLTGRFAGVASGELRLSAKGIGRPALLSSLQGDGSLRVRDAVVPIVNATWADGEGSVPPSAGVSRFTSGTVAFRVANRGIRLEPLLLMDREHEFEATGTVDFLHKLDLHVRPVARATDSVTAGAALAGAWVVAGTLDAPLVSRPPSVAASIAGSVGARH